MNAPNNNNYKSGISHWNEQKEKIKIHFPQLTPEDLSYDESKKDEMFSHLAIRLGVATAYLQTIIETI